jgi:hypothetical protein
VQKRQLSPKAIPVAIYRLLEISGLRLAYCRREEAGPVEFVDIMRWTDENAVIARGQLKINCRVRGARRKSLRRNVRFSLSSSLLQ